LTNNAKKIADEIYDNTVGLKRVEAVELPPKILWGEIFQSWDLEKKLDYLTKFAEAMNHAADLIQNERNALIKLVELKEKEIEQVKPMMEANLQMLQNEITKMNKYKQETHKTIAKLNARIKELERGNLH
jgi:seryl-tRNA synthetase